MALGNLMHFGAEITSSKDKYCLQQAYKTLLSLSLPSTPHESFILSLEIRLDQVQNMFEHLQPFWQVLHPPSVSLWLWAAKQPDQYLRHKIQKF